MKERCDRDTGEARGGRAAEDTESGVRWREVVTDIKAMREGRGEKRLSFGWMREE